MDNTASGPRSACPICGSSLAKELFQVGEYRIVRCETCTGGFVEPMPRGSEMDTIYDSHYGDEYLEGPMHGRGFAETRFRTVTDLLSRLGLPVLGVTGKRVLDIGCGSGHFLALLREAGWETCGLELSPPLARYAVQKLGLDVRQLDFLTADMPASLFHFISMFHVVEHFADPRAAVQKATRLLVPGGALFVETPNWESIGALVRGRRWSHYIPPEHLVYFGPRSLKGLGEACGLDCLVCRTTTPEVLCSLESLPDPARALGLVAYQLASRLGRGPALQYLGRKH